MSTIPGEIKPSTANTVWIATALLHQEHKDRSAFKVEEIFQKIKELGFLTVSDQTIKIHISSHCVANGWASPDDHRKLLRVDTGSYRLYRKGDVYHHSRSNGKITPVSESIPPRFRYLLEWYEKEYCNQKSTTFQEATHGTIAPSFAPIKSGLVGIPSIVREKLKLEEGDNIVFIENTVDTMIIKKARVRYLV